MHFNKSIALLCAAFILTGCTSTVWVQKNFDSIKPTIDTVSILFPQIEFAEKIGDVNKTKSGSSIFVSKNVTEILKEIIDGGKFIPKSAIIVDDSLVLDQWFRSYSAKSMTNYKQIRDSLISQVAEKILPLTPDLQRLVDKLPTKYFIFIAGIGFRLSEATKQYAFQQEQIYKLFYDRPYLNENQSYGLKLLISLVDVKSKQVLWFNYNDDKNSKYDPLVKEDVKSLCLGLLSQK